MSSHKKLNLIQRSDYHRILLTETLPYETPIIFSNDGLYDRLLNIDTATQIERTFLNALIVGDGVSKKRPTSTVPFHYKIRKNSTEFRQLALLHPLSQWKIKEFYKKYEKLILHYCSLSPASIRAPQGIAGSFFSKNSWENINQYKSGTVSLAGLDRFSKHSPSFFSYRGYDRLYKFFDSRDYFTLEKTFTTLWTLDVSKCFDSIYTHSISWAVKSKPFTKQNPGVTATFSDQFDAVIRFGNHNETNGIPIGPEVSRIFSEIIFQKIDVLVISRLENDLKKIFNVDYSFRRYVDDVFIFAKDPDVAKEVYDCYADVLVSFKLHANASKLIKMERPFLTRKSRLIRAASEKSNEFFDKFLSSQENSSSLKPKTVYSPWRLTRSFIETVKSLCSFNEAGYDDIASFLIAVITERVKKLVNNDLSVTPDQIHSDYSNAILILLDVLYFLYGVAPSVGASYKLCTSVILVIRFSKKHIPEHADTVAQRIYELTSTLLSDEFRKDAAAVDGFIPLEALNVILAVRELGDSYLLPESMITTVFLQEGKTSYFKIVSCLFYIKTAPQYVNVRRQVVKTVTDKLKDLSDITVNCEKAYLLMDILSCPYFSDKKKEGWLKTLHTVLESKKPTAAELTDFVGKAKAEHWQINWAEVDLLNLLEKKELKQAY